MTFLNSNGLRYVSIFPSGCMTNWWQVAALPLRRMSTSEGFFSFQRLRVIHLVSWSDAFPGDLKTWQFWMELSKRSILSGSNRVQRVLLLNSVDSGDSVVLKVSVAVVERENQPQARPRICEYNYSNSANCYPLNKKMLLACHKALVVTKHPPGTPDGPCAHCELGAIWHSYAKAGCTYSTPSLDRSGKPQTCPMWAPKSPTTGSHQQAYLTMLPPCSQGTPMPRL